MTRKDFVLIANVLRDHVLEKGSAEDVTRALANELRVTNPNFDKQRFLAACGL